MAELGGAMADPSDPRDVLIVLWPQPRDQEFAEQRGWYRIRPGRAFERQGNPRRFRSLAFYQPDSFGQRRRRIEYWAPIIGLESVKRKELLPEEPDHTRADEVYQVFRLGPLVPLPQPITSERGRRILFIATTREKMRAARDLNDLFAGSPLEERMYTGLRDMLLKPEREFWVQYPAKPDPGAPLKTHMLDFAVFCRERDLDIECDGDRWHVGAQKAGLDRVRDNLLESHRWHILRFGTQDIMSDIDSALARIRLAVDGFGGIVEPSGAVRYFRRGTTLGLGQETLRLDYD